MTFAAALAVLAIVGFVWAEIWGTKEQQKVIVAVAFLVGVVWALTSSF